MRLAALVGKSRVTNTSLWPIGTPAKGPAVPAATAASWARAWARVTSSSMARKAPSACCALARCRKCWAASTAETCWLRMRAASSATPSWCRSGVLMGVLWGKSAGAQTGAQTRAAVAMGLFNHLGHQEQALFGRRCIAQVGLALVGFADHILLQAQLDVLNDRDRMRQRFHARGIDGLHLLDHAKKVVQLGEHARAVLGAQFHACQVGGADDVLGGKCHGAMPVRNRM